MKSDILFIFGTRPEAIKMAPVIKACQEKSIPFKVCVTAQHREMLDPLLNFFDIPVDIDLNLMKPNQTLSELTQIGLTQMSTILTELKPKWVLVQGDTTTTFIGALSAFYHQIPIGHIEAGLRTHNVIEPFPEEINRQCVDRIATLLFAPTESAKRNLLTENIKEDKILITGNTGIDALQHTITYIQDTPDLFETHFKQLGVNPHTPFILLTCHRREHFGQPLEDILNGIKELAIRNPKTPIVFPVHLNPNVQKAAAKLTNINNITCIPPQEYPHFVWLMKHCHIILTDSGGIQEEAPALGKPVVVLRNQTERTESIETNNSLMSGSDPNKIIQFTQTLLDDPTFYNKMGNIQMPYGDGQSSKKIIQHIMQASHTLESSIKT